MPLHPDRIHIIEQKELSCRPCSKIGFDRCPKGHFNCMNLLDTASIIAIANTYP
jgi:heptosyltransferase-2